MSHPSTLLRSAAITLVPAVLVIGLAGCSSEAAIPTVDELMAETEGELVASGVAPEVAECVAELAKRKFRTGPLTEIERDEMVAGCTAAHRALGSEPVDSMEPGPDPLAFVGPYTYGDDPGLDRLWDLCAEGDGQACDDLFEQSPLDSEYEEFGLTCGDRDDVAHCLELLEEPEDPVPAVYEEMSGSDSG